MKYYFTSDDKEKRCELCNQKLINDEYGRIDLCDICYKEYVTKESNLSIYNWKLFNKLSNIIPFSNKLLSIVFKRLQKDDVNGELFKFILIIVVILLAIIYILGFISIVGILCN